MSYFLTAPRPIRSVLVANRGEIACRIAATCRRLGLRVIAVYSEADAHARHVRLADDAYPIGPAPSAESYLNIARLIEVAHQSGADAIHPGYGFLSENTSFARAVEDVGLLFVGPSSSNVEAMGSKIAARRIAQAAGIPIVPGFGSSDACDEELISAAEKIGYPLLVKASAGGGGRGMRQVTRPEELAAALHSARLEAGSTFGDASLFLEKLIANPRHLEVQIFGDGNGNAVHFFERDCSVQRNHQKVIEEAPAPNLPDDVRQALHDYALRLACDIKYAGAGTVEFVMETGEKQPYFLEMNTRLQVEHPVSEAICNVDLVEWQLRQAAGLPLLLEQSQIIPRGHAIEVRLNAELPEKNFLPDSGRIEALAVPSQLRFDSGVEAGDEVSPHYDSMIAKLIAYGPDRAAALDRLVTAIDQSQLTGVGTNLAFLRDCLTTPAFVSGQATTRFLPESFPTGWCPDPAALLRVRGYAALSSIRLNHDPLNRADGFRVSGASAPGEAPLHIEDAYGSAEVTLNFGTPITARAGELTVTLDDAPALVQRQGDRVWAVYRGLSIMARIRPLVEARAEVRADASDEGIIRAPLSGLVAEVRVEPGEKVVKGATLAVMEAMKLVHPLIAPFNGTVAKLSVQAGQTVSRKTLIMEIVEGEG